MKMLNVIFWIICCFVRPTKVCLVFGKNSKDYLNMPILEQELQRKGIPYDLVNEKMSIFSALRRIASAKVLVIDQSNYCLSHISLCGRSKVLQIWHGGGLLKRVGYDKERIKSKSEAKRLKRVYGNLTDVIVSEPRIAKFYASAFNLPISKVHPTGLPRTDLLYNYPKSCKNKEKKTLLIALSYVENSTGRHRQNLDINKLKERLAGKYDVIVKEHPTVAIKVQLDLYETLNRTDVILTDSSSIVFDYSYFNRPIVFLDVEDQSADRFYIDRNKLGYVVSSIDELIEILETKSLEAKPVWENYMSACKGQSTSNVVRLIEDMK